MIAFLLISFINNNTLKQLTMLFILISLQQKFIIDDHQKENILARMRKLWTDYKSRLSISIREAFQMPDATRKLKLLKPEDVTDEEWKKFVAHRLSKDWKVCMSIYYLYFMLLHSIYPMSYRREVKNSNN